MMKRNDVRSGQTHGRQFSDHNDDRNAYDRNFPTKIIVELLPELESST